MLVARQVVSLGLSARAESKLKVRQPLRRAIVLLPQGTALREPVAAEIADALNVKRIETVTSLEGLLDYSIVPNFRRLGPKVGALVPRVKEVLATADGAAIRHALDEHGHFTIDVDGTEVVLDVDDVEVRATSHEELALAQEGAVAVALDTALDHDLRLEGLARELVRTINDLRKATGLEIADRIRVDIETEGSVAEALDRHVEWIAGEILAVELTAGAADPVGDPRTAHELSVDGTSTTIRVERVEPA